MNELNNFSVYSAGFMRLYDLLLLEVYMIQVVWEQKADVVLSLHQRIEEAGSDSHQGTDDGFYM